MTEAMADGESPGFLLWRVTLRWRRRMSVALEPLDLTHVEFVVLTAVWWFTSEGRHPSRRALASLAGTDRATTDEVLRVLQDRNLLVHVDDPTDDHQLLLDITEAGQRLAEESISVVEAADREFFQPVGGGSEFLHSLQRLAGHRDQVA